jgi:hypothetical protein
MIEILLWRIKDMARHGGASLKSQPLEWQRFGGSQLKVSIGGNSASPHFTNGWAQCLMSVISST